MMEFFGEINPYIWISIIAVTITIIAAFLYKPFMAWLTRSRAAGGTEEQDLYEIIGEAGYSYDPDQDIFYSMMDPWQREMGYCRLYDEASAPLNMIIDCEPVYFEYDGKRWLVEFWKGQYGMASGAEIGVYTTTGPDLNIPGIFNGTFYNCASNSDRLYLSYSLVMNDELLMARKGRHWWLTGFKLGKFAEPSELTMYLTVELKSAEMRDAFVEGLYKAGYSDDDLMIDGNMVGMVFDKPRTPQPVTRVPETDWLVQRKNEMLCNKYQEITKEYDNFPDKMKAIREQAPEIYDAVLSIGKSKPLFVMYEELKKYL